MKPVIPLLSLGIILALCPDVRAVHAWVDGRSDYLGGIGSSTLFDVADNGEGIVQDHMVHSVAGIEGAAQLSDATVSLMVRSSGVQSVKYAWGRLLDSYAFGNLANPGAAGPIPQLWVDIPYSGQILANSGSGQFSVTTPFGSESVSGTGNYSGIWSFPVTASYGVPWEVGITFRAYADGGTVSDPTLVDFGSTANLEFRSEEPGVILSVTSLGGYSSIPEPGTCCWASVLGVAAVLLGWRKRMNGWRG